MRSARVTPNTVATPSDYNALINDATGASQLLAHQMYGTIALPTNPTNGQTLTLDINGTNVVITFVSAIGSTAGNVLIAASAVATAANLIQLLLNPTITNSTQVAIGVNTSANVTLINYINWSASGTSIVASSYNATLYAPATSFTASTTATGGSYTANTMALYVEPGVVYVGGTRVIFAGGVTPTVTGPVSHPRIDVLAINSSGVLSWTTGTENASPVAPTYPTGQVALCELYNVVGETALYDNANQGSGQGYISTDVRPLLGSAVNLLAVASNIVPDADATRNLGSSGTRWNNGYFASSVFVNGNPIASAKFGGTGTDGALAITSGTTTLSCSSLGYLEKNYSSISITSTANLAFSSPNNTSGTTVALRSQGNVTITTSSSHAIDMRSMGGGLATGVTLFAVPSNAGGGGGGGGGGSGAGAGTNGTASFATTAMMLSMGGPTTPPLSPYLRFAFPGGNGAAGSSGGANGFSPPNGGAGGLGAGGLYIECGAAYNFTTGTIDLTGATGSTGVSGGGGGTGSGGGGGGGGGNCLVLYVTLTADSGTYSATGGAGGGTAVNGSAGAAGAGGTTLRAVNNHFA